MTIEASQFISQLNTSFPRSTDLLKEGDDHIRLIKANLKNTFPNILNSVSISSDTLNYLNDSVQATSGGLTIKKALSFNSGTGINFNSNVLTNVGSPTATAHAATKGYVDAFFQRLYPVGGLYFTTVAMSASQVTSLMGFGTWVAHFPGAAIVSMGPNNPGGFPLSTGSVWGEATHKLSYNEMPVHSHANDAHSHSGTTGNSNQNINHTHGGVPERRRVEVGGNTGTIYNVYNDGNTSGPDHDLNAHQHNFGTNAVTIGIHNSGGDAAHNNVQPSIGVYVWRRTA